MRRSSSRQRGSRLPERSIAPPVDQKRFQCSRAARRVSSKRGERLRPSAASGAKRHRRASSVSPPSGRRRATKCVSALPPSSRPAGAQARRHVVAVVVEASRELGASRRPSATSARLVRLRPGPVRRGRVARAVGEAQPDRDLPAPRRAARRPAPRSRPGAGGRASRPRPLRRRAGSGCAATPFQRSRTCSMSVRSSRVAVAPVRSASAGSRSGRGAGGAGWRAATRSRASAGRPGCRRSRPCGRARRTP